MELERVVTNLVFDDPYIIRVRTEQTWRNTSGSLPAQRIELERSEFAYFSNLKVFDRQGRRLEVIPSEVTKKPDLVEIDTIDQIPPGAFYSVYIEHTEAYENLPFKFALLFKKPTYSFQLPLGSFTRYIYVQPPSRVLVKLALRESFLSKLLPYQVIDSPPKRNAIFLRFSRFSFTPQIEAALLKERLSRSGLRGDVWLADSEIRIEFSQARILKLLRVIPGPLKTFGDKLPLIGKIQKRLTIKVRRIFEREYALRKMASVAVSLHLPFALRMWFWLAVIVGLIVGIAGASPIASTSAITLLAVTRSWLFYEEKMMRNAGIVFVVLLLTNIINLLSLTQTCDPNCRSPIELLSGTDPWEAVYNLFLFLLLLFRSLL